MSAASRWAWRSSPRSRWRRCAACGTACWWPRSGMQPIIATLILMVAGRGVAQLITDGQIITVYYAPYFFIGNGFLLGLPFALFIAAAVWLRAAPADDAHRARPVHPGDRHQPGGGARWPALPRAADHRLRLRLLRLRGRRRGADRSAPTSRAPTATTPACCSSSTPSWPSRSAARRSPAGASAWPAACSAR